MARKLTNKYNLPETLVKAAAYDTHRVSGDLSVTQLIDAPQIRILKKRNDYTEDVSESIYALMGTALHHILERANIDSVRKRAFILTAETIMRQADILSKDAPDKAEKLRNGANWIFSLIPIFFPETEERYLFEVTLRVEYDDLKAVLYGTFDIYDKWEKKLWDYKFCSVYQYIYEDSRKKWWDQGNIYANMLRKNGYPVEGISIVAFFRDWSATFNREKDYPERPIMEIPCPLYSYDDIEKYITERIRIHRLADQGIIQPCTGQERWASSDSFAVMTAGAKRAHRVFDMREAALAYIEENRAKLNKPWIQNRPGYSRRCEKYCPVADFCGQRQEELQKLASLQQQGI